MAKKKAAPEPEKIIRLEDDAIMVQGEIRALAKLRECLDEKHSWAPQDRYGIDFARSIVDDALEELGGREVAPGYNGDPNAYKAKMFTLIQDAAFQAHGLLPMFDEEAKSLVADVAAAAVKAERERGDALRAAIGSLADVLFAPANESAALTKAMGMVASALAQDDGALRKMKGIDT